MWGKNAKAEMYGFNRDAVQRAENIAADLCYPRRIRAVLVYMASKMDGLWCDFRDCIAWIMKATDYSRSSVCEALSVLRKDRVISYDGQIHVGRERPVAKYRIESTPDFPVPLDVSEKREQVWIESHEQDPEWEPVEDVSAGQGSDRTKNLQTAGYVGDNRSSGSPLKDVSQEELRSSIYPPALPGRTGPEAGPEPMGGNARWVPHLGPSSAPSRRTTRRMARDAARRLLGVVVPRKVVGAGGVREEVSPAVCQPGNDLPVGGKIAVTYSPRTTEGAAMTPFTDPALGALPIDIRLFYLGLRSLADSASMIIADARYLKAELFRYDDNITPADISNWINTLTSTGKIHIVPGHLLLSDPNAEATADGALFAFPAPKPLKQNNEQDFETFWHYYPRRTGKGAARKAFQAAVAKGTPARRIIEAASSYANTCRMIGKEIQFTPHPSVWLNQERWDDDPEQAPQVRSRVDDAFRHNMMMVEQYRQQELGNNNTPKEIGPSW